MSEIILKEGSTPSTPASGQVSLYAKDGGLLYTKDDIGIEKFVGGYFDGWIPINIAPVYVSATSIRFENINLSGAFPVGTKIKFTQTTVKYFYVIKASYSGGHTVLTVTGGSDYTVANAAISGFAYAHGLAKGFPEWFAYSVTAGAHVGSLGTHTTYGMFNIIKNTCFFYTHVAITSNGTATVGIYLTYPLTPTAAGYRREHFSGASYNSLSGGINFSVVGHIGFSAGNFSVYKYDGTHPGLNSSVVSISGFYQLPA